MASISNGDLYLGGLEEMTFEKDGWVVVKVEPQGFNPLTLHLSPTFANRLRDNKLDILTANSRLNEGQDEPEAATVETE